MRARSEAPAPTTAPTTTTATTTTVHRFLTGAALASALLLGACGGELTPEQLQEKATAIHRAAWTADTHIDAPSSHLGDEDWRVTDAHVYGEEGAGQWDLPRMEEGGLDAAWLVVWTRQQDLTPENYAAAYQRARDLLRWITRQANIAMDARIAYTAEAAVQLHEEGKSAFFIGMENGFPIAEEIGRVEAFYRLGVRYMTLAHTADNQIAASSFESDEREDFGLTDFGREVVREMNRVGMMVDLSHVSDQAFYDVLEMTDVPVILSHSGCRAIASSPRNITDDMLERLAENGGVIQLVALDSYVKDVPPNEERDAALQQLREEFGEIDKLSDEQRDAYRERRRELFRQFPDPPVTLDDFMEHVDHAVAVAGIDHVGFGSDFDGGGGLEGLEDVTDLPEITVKMLERGYTEEEIRKFWGGNLLRVMREVEEARTP